MLAREQVQEKARLRRRLAKRHGTQNCAPCFDATQCWCCSRCLSLMSGPAADTGWQWVLGKCGLGLPKPSSSRDATVARVAGMGGAGCGKGFDVLRGSPLHRSPCVCQVAGAAAGGSAALGLSACDLKRRWLAGRLCPQAWPLRIFLCIWCFSLWIWCFLWLIKKIKRSILASWLCGLHWIEKDTKKGILAQ